MFCQDMSVKYVNHMGDDLLVVNAARVSFSKRKDVFDKTDEKLIKYLARHNHWTPFGHPQICLLIKTPIPVRTQLFKHKQGFVENEVSRRYVDSPPEFYVPSAWRERPSNGMKQGSGGLSPFPEDAIWNYHKGLKPAMEAYKGLIDIGICPEQARMVLPQAMMTEWYWTGSLAAYARVYGLRTDPHAQEETANVVKKMADIIAPLFPISWKYLTEKRSDFENV